MQDYDFRRDTRGVVIILFSILLPVLIGLMALAIDVSMTLYQKNEAQRAADAAAMSAIKAAVSSSQFSSSMYTPSGNALNAGINEAYEIANKNGYPNKCIISAPPCVTVNSPPTYSQSKYVNQAGTFEVTITIPQTRIWSAFFGKPAGTAKVRALSQGSSPCILVLHKSNEGTLEFSGGGKAVAQCAIIVNSNWKANTSSGTTLLSGGSTAVVGSLTLMQGSQVYSNSKPSGDPCASSKVQSVLNCPYFTTTSPVLNPLSDHNILYTPPPIPSTPSAATTTLPTGTAISGDYDLQTYYNSQSNKSTAQKNINSTLANATLSYGTFVVPSLSLANSTSLTLASGTNLVVNGDLAISGTLTVNSGANLYVSGNVSVNSGGTLTTTATTSADKFIIKGGISNSGTVSLNGSSTSYGLFYVGDNTVTDFSLQSQYQISYNGNGNLTINNGTLMLAPITTFGGSGSNISITLSSPSSGPWQNISVFQPDPPKVGSDTQPYNPPTLTATSFNATKLSFSASGAFVMPYTIMTFAATSTAATKCTFFIVSQFKFSGSPTLGSGCALGQGFSGIGQGLLVE